MRFLLQAKDMKVRLTGGSNCECECEWYVSVQVYPTSPELQMGLAPGLKRISSIADGWLISCLLRLNLTVYTRNYSL